MFTYRTDARGKLVGKCSAGAVDLLVNPSVTYELKLADNFGRELGATVVIKLTYTPPPPMDISQYVRSSVPIQQDALSVIKDTYQLRFNIHECRKLTHQPCDPVRILNHLLYDSYVIFFTNLQHSNYISISLLTIVYSRWWF